MPRLLDEMSLEKRQIPEDSFRAMKLHEANMNFLGDCKTASAINIKYR